MAAGKRAPEISQNVLLGLLRAADIILLIVSALLAYAVRFGTPLPTGQEIAVIAITAILSANVFHAFRLYEFASLTDYLFQSGKLFVAWLLVILFIINLGFLTKTSENFSRIWIVLWFTFGFVLMATNRFAFKLKILGWQRSGYLVKRIAVIGAGDQGERFVQHIHATEDIGEQLIGIFDDRKTRVPDEIEGVPISGTVNDLIERVRANEVDNIVVALPWDAEQRLVSIVSKLRSVPVNVWLCPESVAYRFPNQHYGQFTGISMLNVFERPLSHWASIVKSVEDRVLASLILIFIMPLLLCIALAIRLDSRGPIFFRQERHGFNNEIFRVYKFRTMYQDSAAQDGSRQAIRNDPRVTRIGAFLRRTSLDELPQFFNVIEGSMSIVGPRPHPLSLNDQFASMIQAFFARHNVKPGITGWAQINGFRGETGDPQLMQKRVEYDLFYIENWSLLFDLRIIFLTVFRGFANQNAY